MTRRHRRTVQKKNLNDTDNHDGTVTYPEPDILECEVKWALGRTAGFPKFADILSAAL